MKVRNCRANSNSVNAMEALSDLFGFIGAIGDEISTIILGDDEVEVDATAGVIRPIVIAGPSGVGKGTLIAMLMKEYPDAFGFSVSHTTRDPRPGETNGVEYHFTDRATMAAMIEAGDFIESADVHGNYYGTSKAAVTSVVARNKICILDIDVQGVQSVKKANMEPEPRYIFIKPPSIEELEKRLRTRGTENEEKIQRRLKGAIAELKYADENGGSNFDLIITNDALDKAYSALKAAIEDILNAVAAAQEASAAPVASAAPAAAESAPAAAPNVAAVLAQKEKELEAAEAAKDRAKQRQLLTEIEELEKSLKK